MAPLRVRVRYLGSFSQLAGRREETVELENGADVGELARALVSRHGRELRSRLEDGATRPVLFIVGGQPAERTRPLEDGDEVLLTYPAGGG